MESNQSSSYDEQTNEIKNGKNIFWIKFIFYWKWYISSFLKIFSNQKNEHIIKKIKSKILVNNQIIEEYKRRNEEN